MKFIIKILKKRRLLPVIGFLLLIVLILAAGSWFKLSLEIRLLGVILVLLIGVLWLWLKQMRANRGAALLEHSIKAQAEAQQIGLKPEKREEIEELKGELLAAINSLKKSRLGQGGSGRAALYALPWYMFIGPPAAGKTTAIINSGLEFSFGSDIKGVGGTRNCDWFFSNSAILLDTAGRYVTEDEDKEEWQAFLDILKKCRRRTPINGVIVGMSIVDLMKASGDEVEWHAKNIRRRIDELVQRLGIHFPVYVVFTKCDLLQGFVEVFEDLSRKEREQIWGCTIPREAQPVMPREVFDREFQVLLHALEDMRLRRLASAMKPEYRSAVYTFPLQVSAIKENVGLFLSKLFQPNPYQEGPAFRGFYFTSGTQEGVPIDLVIQAVSKQFGLRPELVSEPEIQKKSYFIKGVFTEVIIPDQNLVTRTTRAAVRRNLVRAGAIISAAVILGALVFGVSQAYLRSKADLSNLGGAGESLNAVRWDRDASLADNFKRLDRLREQLVKMEEESDHFRLFRSGLPRARVAISPAQKLYVRKAGPFVQAYLYRELEGFLRESKDGASFPREKVYDALKAYLLMGAEKGRLDAQNKGFLKQELMSFLEERYAEIFPEDRTGEMKPFVERQVDYFVKCIGVEGLTNFENNDQLVGSIRRLIYERADIAGIYARLRREGLDALSRPFLLSQILDAASRELVSSDSEVPEFFTIGGWNAYVKEAIDKESRNPSKVDWVLGQTPEEIRPDLLDPEKVAEELRVVYFREYAETWWRFCRSVRFKPWDSLESASASLRKLSNIEESPLELILESLAEQTWFEEGEKKSGLLEKAAAASKKVGRKIGLAKKLVVPKSRKPSHPVLKAFESLHTMIGEVAESGSSKELDELYNQYAIIREAIDALVKEGSQKAKEAAAKILLQEAGELPEALKAIRKTLNENNFDLEARQALFEQPIRNAWTAILAETQKSLNELWLHKVYEPFKEILAAYYPFNPQGKDASVQEVKRFFDPQGGLFWTFVGQELKPFINLDTLTPNTWEGAGISISENAIEVLRRAEAIKQALFSTGGLRMSFRLQPELYERISGSLPYIEQVCLTIEGKMDCYRMGGLRWIDFSWPGLEPIHGASLKVYSRQGNFEPISYDGEWGWFRLLDLAVVAEETPREYQIYWLFGSKDANQLKIKYKLQASSAVHPFRQRKEFFNWNCPEKLN